MRIFMKVVVFCFLFSCGQDFNSNTFDADRFREADIDTSSPEGQRLAAAVSIINNRCTACHEGYHSYYNTLTTDRLWIDSGLVEPGDFSGSFLVTRLINFGSNMPKNGSALTIGEVQTLRDWIEQMPTD
jgi:hypothetical protein